MQNELTWIEISRSALKHNLEVLRSLSNGAKLAPPVKGNAYGHGMTMVVNELIELGVEWLSVTNVREAIKIRENGIDVPILVFGAVLACEYEQIVLHKLTVVVHDFETARGLSQIAHELYSVVDVHIEIDTGMHRQGMLKEQVDEFMMQLSKLSGIKICGLMTHFATSDLPSDEGRMYFNNQLLNFNILSKRLIGKYPAITETHCANSGAVLGKKISGMTIIRPGIAMYGLWPSCGVYAGSPLELEPVLSWKARVVQIKDLPEGAHISYGCTYKTREPKKIAVLPVGYYDGLFRSMSNKGEVLINGERAPILGRVCMNHTVVDVSLVKNIKLGDEVVLIGIQGNERITADDHARWEGTINYEIVTKLPSHIKRIVV